MPKGFINLYVNAKGLFVERGQIVDCDGNVIPPGLVSVRPTREECAKAKRKRLRYLRKIWPGMNAVTLAIEYSVRPKKGK